MGGGEEEGNGTDGKQMAIFFMNRQRGMIFFLSLFLSVHVSLPLLPFISLFFTQVETIGEELKKREKEKKQRERGKKIEREREREIMRETLTIENLIKNHLTIKTNIFPMIRH